MEKWYKNILVGGSGFIGSTLAMRLAQKGESVLVIARHRGPVIPGVDTLILDIHDQKLVEQSFPAGENVFILIGQNSANFNIKDELQNLRNLIKALNRLQPKRVFYTSSALVYGECDEPAHENDQMAPVEEYSRFKLAAEELLQKNLESTIHLGILRLANVYGSPKNRGFIGLVLGHLAKGETGEILLNGDGQQERDYIFLDDVIEALLVLQKGLKKSEAINIATGKSSTLLEIVRTISTLVNKPIPFALSGKTLTEVGRSRISNEKLKEKYRYTPKATLAVGLRKTYQRYHEETAKISPSKDTLKKKMLLVGGEGFIGRNLAAYFSHHYDCYSTGRSISLFPGRGDNFIQLNPYREAVPGEYDVVIHLIDNKISPKLIFREEKKLLHHLNLKPNAHLIIFSSAVVYVNPNSEYGQRKKNLEKFYQDYCEQHGIYLTIFRPFNLFGPFQLPYRQGSLVANLIYNFLTGKATEINDMEAKRDFVYAPDIVKFIEYVLFQHKNGIFDIGSGKLTRVRDVINHLNQTVFQKPISIIDRQVRESIPEQPATQVLSTITPMVDFDEGLKQTFVFYKKYFHLL